MAKTCYNPDGSISASNYPCNESAENSHCCQLDHVCLDNGYCFGGETYGNLMSRESCTDQSWTDPACPHYCSDVAVSLGNPLQCAADAAERKFCCEISWNTTSGMCDILTHGSAAPFLVPNGNVIYNRTSGSTGPNNTIGYTTTVHTVTVTAAAATAPAATGTLDRHSNTVAVGAGVGVSLGVLLLAALSLLLLQFRRRKALERQLHDQYQEMQGTRNAAPYVKPEDTAFAANSSPRKWSRAKRQDDMHPPVEMGGPPAVELGDNSRPPRL